MKGFTYKLLLFLSLLCGMGFAQIAFAQITLQENTEETVEVKPPMEFSFDPINIDGRLFIPAEDICSAIGIKVSKKADVVTLTKGNTTIAFTVWSKNATLNGQKIELPFKVFEVNVQPLEKPLPSGIKLAKQDKPSFMTVTIIPLRLITDSFDIPIKQDGDILILGNAMWQLTDKHRVLTNVDTHENWWIEGSKILKRTKISPASTGINVLYGQPIPTKTVIRDGKKTQEEVVCNLLGDFVAETENDFDFDHKSSEFNDAPMNWAVHIILGRWFHECTKSELRLIGSDASHGCMRESFSDAQNFYVWVKDYVVNHNQSMHIYIIGKLPNK